MSGAGVKQVPAGKTLTLNVSGNGYLYLDGTTLQNLGTISYTGNSYQLYSKNGAILENQTSGLVDLQNDWTFFTLNSGALPTVNNAGVFRKSAGAGISATPAVFNNTGTIDVQTGTLSLEGGGTDSGTFTVASGATLQFNGGTHLWQGGVSSSGAGVLKIAWGTVQADGAVTLSSSTTLYGGTLTGSGLVTFNGPTTWSGGTMSGAGVKRVPAGKTLAINAGGNGHLYLDGTTLQNQGTISYTGSSYQLYSKNGSILENQASGLVDLQNDWTLFTLHSGAQPTVNNAGIFRKSAGAGISATPAVFNNTGTVDVQTGTLSLEGGGTDSGTYTVASGATLQFNGGTHLWQGGVSSNGAGVLKITSGTVQADGAVTLSSGATLSGGILTGSGLVTFNGPTTWSGGTMSGAGVKQVPAGETLAINVSGNGHLYLDGTTLQNQGTISYTGSSYQFYNKNGAILENQASGLVDLQNDRTFLISAGGTQPTINNAGTFRKSAGAGISATPAVFNNTGTVNVQTGTLSLEGGGTVGGTYDIASGATIQFNGGTHTLNGVVTSTGAGLLAFASGTLTGSGTINGPMTWSSGTVTGAGIKRVATGKTLTLNVGGLYYLYLDGTTLQNQGTILYTGTTYYCHGNNGTILENQASGLVDLRNDRSFLYWASTGVRPTINNAGTFRKSAGAGISTTPALFNNTGTVDVQTGTLSLEGGGTDSGIFSAASGATLQFNGGTHVWQNGVSSGGDGVLKIALGTVQVDADVILAGGTSLAGGTLTGNGAVTFNAPATWSGGTMSGAGVKRVATGKTLTLNVGGTNYLYLDGTTLQNQGTILYTGSPYHLSGNNGVILENQASGLVDLQNDRSFLYWASTGTRPTINNAGIFRKSAGVVTSTTPAVFNNTGTVDVQTGTLSLEAGGTSSGTFIVASGATLQFNGGTHVWQGGVSSSGAGVLKIASGTIQVDAAVTLGSGVSLVNGTLVGNEAMLFNGESTLSGGTLTGSGAVTFNAPATWSGGTMSGAGVKRVATGKTLTLNTGGTTHLYLDGATLQNQGTILYTGSGYLFYGSNSASLENQASGLVDLQNDRTLLSWSSGTRPTINNAGIFRKSAGAGTSTTPAVFNNTGTVDVQTGTLSLEAGGTSSGAFIVASGTTLQFNGGTHVWQSGAACNAAGLLKIASGTVQIDAAVTLDGGVNVVNGTLIGNDAMLLNSASTISGGTLTGSGAVTFNAPATWSGGTMSGAGVKRVAAGKTLTLSTGGTTHLYLDGATLQNQGTILYTGSVYLFYGSNSAILENQASGLVDLQNDRTLLSWSSGTRPTINNAGTLRKSAGAGTSITPAVFNNTGTVEVQTGTLSLEGGGISSGLFDVTSGATLQFNGNTHVWQSGVTCNAAGLLKIASGTVQIDAAVTLDGGVNVVNGTLIGNDAMLLNGASTFSGGTLTGSGAVTFNAPATWSGGTMSGAGVKRVATGKTLTLNTGGTTHLYLDGTTLRNQGTILYTGTAYNFYGNNGAILENQASGLVDLQNDRMLLSLSSGTRPTINNAGIFRKSAGTGTSNTPALFNNTGTVDVQTGTLSLEGGGAGNGVFNVAGSAILRIGNSTIYAAGDILGGGDLTIGSYAKLTVDSIAVQTLTIGAGAGVTIRESAGGATDASAVPEPSTLALLIAGVLGMLAYAWRRR